MSSDNVVCASGDPKLDAAVNYWLKIDRNEKTRKEVIDDIKERNWNKFHKTMLSRQKFGTAGMRGRMGAGFNCMNDVIVLQTAQGLLSYLQKESSQDKLRKGIVVGFDGRYNSKRFAYLTTGVFVRAKVPVFIHSAVVATPLVSFGVIELGAAAGVMVTASHNPKEDNGYKVYWNNGSQIISPHDENLLEEISQCLEIPDENWNISDIPTHELVHDVADKTTPIYVDYLRDSLHEDVLADNKKYAIDVVYSAMHGTGYRYIVDAFKGCNLKPVISVEQQQHPDPEFSTVVFPNPEELECLALSKELALQHRARLVLVNDPDADRLAVAEYQESTKQWKGFTGNEMGALLGWWLLQQYYKRNPTADPEDVYVLASVVSSKMLSAIVQGRGQFVQTLTGFKWMGNTTLLLQQQGKVPLFAFEEAIGYMCHPNVPDKDGISAAVHVASLATNLYAKGSSLKEQLGELYKEYGYHITDNSYYIIENQVVIQNIFRGIRNYDGPGKYPKKVGSAEIVYIHDMAAGVKIPEKDEGDVHLNVLGTGLDREYTSGEMVMFRTRGGLSVTVRTSGTEPKVKYYTELVYRAGAQSEEDEDMMRIKLRKMVDEFIENLLQPEKHGLRGAQPTCPAR